MDIFSFPQNLLSLSVPKFRRKALQSAADKSFSLAAPAGSMEQFTYFYLHSKLSVIMQKMFKNSSISSVD